MITRKNCEFLKIVTEKSMNCVKRSRKELLDFTNRSQNKHLNFCQMAALKKRIANFMNEA